MMVQNDSRESFLPILPKIIFRISATCTKKSFFTNRYSVDFENYFLKLSHFLKIFLRDFSQGIAQKIAFFKKFFRGQKSCKNPVKSA